jgi:hypothetical protein
MIYSFSTIMPLECTYIINLLCIFHISGIYVLVESCYVWSLTPQISVFVSFLCVGLDMV